MKQITSQFHTRIITYKAGIACLLWIAVHGCLHGQNLVTNGSFEIANPCPNSTSQIDNATGWKATNLSPDYYHACAPMATQVSTPTNVCGYQVPATGDAYMALLCYGSFASSYLVDFREFASNQLTTPLSPGITYLVRFKVALMNAASHAIDHIGAKFTVGLQPVQSITNSADVYSTQIISDTLNWTTIQGYFTPTVAYTHIVIGNHFADTLTNTSVVAPVTFGWNGYYFVDDVEVIPASALFVNTCFGDSTIFTNISMPNTIATEWSFGDPASGLLNQAYSLNSGHVFSAPGTYTVTTINYNVNGGSDTLTTIVNIVAPPAVNLGNDTTLCLGSILTLGNTIGSANYNWSTGDTTATINTSVSGTYWQTASIAGCAATDTVTVNFVLCSLPSVNIASSDSIFCEKQSIDFFDLSTNSPTQWQWYFTGALPATSTDQNPTAIFYPAYGSFNVALKACNSFGCDSIMFPIFITELQNPPTPSVSVVGSLLCCSPASTYAWYETGNLNNVLATTQCYQPLLPGNYFVLVADSAGCASPSATIAITGIHTLSMTTQSVYYFQGQLHLNGISSSPSQLHIINAIGQKVATFYTPDKSINMDFLQPGLYVYYYYSEKQWQTGKFFVK